MTTNPIPFTQESASLWRGGALFVSLKGDIYDERQQQPANDTTSSVLSFDEAPACWNTRYLDPNGFECQITLRGESGSELLEKATSAIA